LPATTPWPGALAASTTAWGGWACAKTVELMAAAMARDNRFLIFMFLSV
jgi:hypothetical protein